MIDPPDPVDDATHDASDDPPTGPTGADDTDWVDDLGRRAGAAIRTPASAADLQRLRQRHARRRTTTAIATGTAVLALTVGALTIVAGDDAQPGPSPMVTTSGTPAPSTTVTTATPTTTLTPVTAPPTTTASERPLRPLTPEPSNSGVAPAYAYGAVGTWATLLPDGESILLASPDDGVPDRVYDIDTGAFVREFRHENEVSFGPRLFDPSGRFYYDGSSLRDATTGSVLRQYLNNGWGAGFDADGSRLAVLSGSGSISLLDTAKNSRIWASDALEMSDDLRRPATLLRFADDGSELYVGDQILDAATGELLPGVAPRPSGDGFWDPTTRQTLGVPTTECDPTITEGPARTPGCDISDDGSVIAVVSDGVLQIWETTE